MEDRTLIMIDPSSTRNFQHYIYSKALEMQIEEIGIYLVQICFTGESGLFLNNGGRIITYHTPGETQGQRYVYKDPDGHIWRL